MLPLRITFEDERASRTPELARGDARERRWFRSGLGAVKLTHYSAITESPHGRSTMTRSETRLAAPGRRATLRFVGSFALLLGTIFVLSRTEFFVETVSPASISANADVAASLLNLFGEDALAHDNMISTRRFRLIIANACDAAEPLGLFTAAVLASPASMLSRLAGLAVGGFLILLMNQVRIVTLYFAGVYFPRALSFVHTDVWPPLFIALCLTIWLLWANWTIRGVARHA